MRSLFNLLMSIVFKATNVLTAGLPMTQEQHPDPVELNADLTSKRRRYGRAGRAAATAITTALPLEGLG